MEAEDMSSEDVFEIFDHTAVTPLEILAAGFETAFHEWNIHGRRPSYNFKAIGKDMQLAMKEMVINCEPNSFYIRWYYPAIEEEQLPEKTIENHPYLSASAIQTTSSEIDFSSLHNIIAMYGVVEFLLLEPMHASNDRIANLEQKDFVLSAIQIACSEAQCEVPVFVLMGDPDRELFFGASRTPSIWMSFEAIHLRFIQPRHRNLTGLMYILKEHLNTEMSLVDMQEMTAAIRFEYNFKEPSKQPKARHLDERKIIRDCRDCTDSLDMVLVTRWPETKESMVHENESYSNLVPADSSHWSIFADFHPIHQPLSHRLKLAILLSMQEHSQKASRLFVIPPEGLQHLMERMNFEEEQLSEYDSFRKLLGGAVMDAVVDSDKRQPSWTRSRPEPPSSPIHEQCLEELRQCKANAAQSIVSRLAVQLLNVIEDEGEIATKWIAFVRLLRHHINYNIPLPNMEHVKSPNHGTSIFNQRLELLHCCIMEKLLRHSSFDNVKDFSDNFFDAEETFTESDKLLGVEATEPMGRVEQLEQEFLIGHPDVPLYVPQTLAACPMTEEMAAEHAEFIASLAEGDERTEAQLGMLRSDMQAFKAANPLAEMSDFIRWHSPKDWDADKRELSKRMRLEKNIWERCWNEARPIPAVHQQPQFNDAKVAEGILSKLENATISEIIEMLLPSFFYFTALQLISDEDGAREIGDGLRMCREVNGACRSTISNRQPFYQALMHIRNYERKAHFYSHLFRTFWRQQFLQTGVEAVIHKLIEDLIKESGTEKDAGRLFRDGVVLSGGAAHPLNQVIMGDFQGQNGLLKRHQLPDRKCYIVRWNIPYPGASSRLCPQRLFAVFEQDNYRIHASFTSDGVML